MAASRGIIRLIYAVLWDIQHKIGIQHIHTYHTFQCGASCLFAANTFRIHMYIHASNSTMPSETCPWRLSIHTYICIYIYTHIHTYTHLTYTEARRYQDCVWKTSTYMHLCSLTYIHSRDTYHLHRPLAGPWPVHMHIKYCQFFNHATSVPFSIMEVTLLA